MYRQGNRFLFILLCALLLCSSAQATILQISVQDSTDNSTIPHAMVFLNGENFARTNNNGQVFLNHSGLNDTLIRVSMTGYNDWENLVAKNETAVFANLSRKSITLNVSLYDSDSLGLVSGARVTSLRKI
jgi:p-aminobenzoyl-glutamate transporter AbgT